MKIINKKSFLTIFMLVAVILGNESAGYRVYAEEPLPLESLDIQKDPLGVEDGEALCDENRAKEKEAEMPYFRCQRYRSSGVASVVYKATVAHGIDVSKHQGNINWAQVKASGVKFAMIRVGYRGYETGALCVDPYFEQNIQNALAAGLKVGVYFFSQAITEQEAYEEASLTLQMIQKYNITYPVAFDWETASGYRTYNAGIVGARMTAIASKFCDTVQAAGYIPIVYANTVDFHQRFEFEAIAAKYYIWYARYLPEYGGTVWYKEGNRLPNYDNLIRFNVWQYMSDGTVPGVNGNCDVNVSFLDFGTFATREIQLVSRAPAVIIDEKHKCISGFSLGSIYQDVINCFPGFSVTINGKNASENPRAKLKTGDKLVFTSTTPYTYLKDGNYTFFYPKDVNGDGYVSVLDMEEIQKYLLTMTVFESAYYQAADANGDGKLSVIDIEEIQKYLLGFK